MRVVLVAILMLGGCANDPVGPSPVPLVAMAGEAATVGPAAEERPVAEALVLDDPGRGSAESVVRRVVVERLRAQGFTVVDAGAVQISRAEGAAVVSVAVVHRRAGQLRQTVLEVEVARDGERWRLELLADDR